MNAAAYGRRPSLQAASQALAGAGAGLLVWLAISIAMLLGRTGVMQGLANLQLRGLAVVAVLLLLALPALAVRPADTWQVRTRLAWGLSLLATLALLGLQLWPPQVPGWTTLSAALGCLGAMAMATCMGQAGQGEAGLSLHGPMGLALALLGGMAMLLALVSLHWPGTMPALAPLSSLLLLGVTVAGLLLASWKADGGLRRPGRVAVLALLTVVPWALAGLAQLLASAASTCWWLLACSVLAGMVWERMLARTGA